VSEPLVDIHCHMLPGIDDGAEDWATSLAMARMAVDDGLETVIVTPHQLGGYQQNRGEMIRSRTAELQQRLESEHIPLRVLPGADVRIEDGMLGRLQEGDVVTLGDHGRHILLELPHELYLPLEGLLEQLARMQMVGILSHPERNLGLLRQPEALHALVEAGCLMQVTASSISGGFGEVIQRFAVKMLSDGLVHFVATDAHGVRSRRPLLQRAYQYISQRVDETAALDLCCRHPAAVAAGMGVTPGPRKKKTHSMASWLVGGRTGRTT